MELEHGTTRSRERWREPRWAQVAGTGVSVSVVPSAHWAPDPFHRHELRFWGGNRWSALVSDTGTTGFDPVD